MRKMWEMGEGREKGGGKDWKIGREGEMGEKNGEKRREKGREN